IRHSDDNTALMAPFYQNFDEGFTLPEDDRIAIQTLYGPADVQPILPPRTDPPRTDPPRIDPPRPNPPRPYTPRPSPPTTHPPRPYQGKCPNIDKPNGPDMCEGNVDAAFQYSDTLIFFKETKVWWVRPITTRGYTIENIDIYYLFRSLPKTFTSIDAAYENPADNTIALFSKDKVYIQEGFNSRGQSYSLEELGIHVSSIEAAMVWGHNGRIYIFGHNQYWRLTHVNKKPVVD
ncbi:unnamed protein product, partial [Meganyctiphanes norvegica]